MARHEHFVHLSLIFRVVSWYFVDRAFLTLTKDDPRITRNITNSLNKALSQKSRALCREFQANGSQGRGALREGAEKTWLFVTQNFAHRLHRGDEVDQQDRYRLGRPRLVQVLRDHIHLTTVLHRALSHVVQLIGPKYCRPQRRNL